MENANKALFIATGVLMGMMILSLGVFLYHSLGGYIRSTQDTMEFNAVNSFNQHFFAFAERDNISIQEIITLTNFVKETNKKNGFETIDNSEGRNDYVTVNIYESGSDTAFLKYTSPVLPAFTFTCQNLESNSKADDCVKFFPSPEYKFKCKNIHLSSFTGRCYQIDFEEN